MIESGTVLQDRFLIEKELARGGMGAVYLATDQKFGSRVAIKERFYEDAQLAEAFAREARILNCLHHPILPHVSDYFSEDGGQFLVMEYIEGEDLSEILKREGKAFPVTDVVRWMLELLDGLDFLHSQDPPIVHRDIKPGNLKLTSRGNLVLLDFGLAKETGRNNQGVRSVFGYSRRYSPLEQIEGAGTSPRSDIFSLGATAYHLITGEAPVDVLARASSIVAGRPDPLRPASDVNGDVDPAIAQVIHRAVALDPDQRFASAGDMHGALYDALDEESSEEQLTAPIENSSDIWVPIPTVDSIPEPVVQSLPAQHVSETTATFSNQSEIRPNSPAKPVRSENRSALGWRSLAVAGAVVLLSLLAIGYTVSTLQGFEGANEQVTNASEHAVAEPLVVPRSNDGSEQSVDSDSAEDKIPEPEISQAEVLPEAAEKIVVERPAARRAPTASRRTDTNMREAAKERSEKKAVDVSKARKRSVDQRDRPAVRSTRRNASRRNSYETPVSSIEMIFTGIPPERQRRSRRSQPF